MFKFKKRYIKMCVIIGTPIVMFCAISYVSIYSLSKENESTSAYEEYHNNIIEDEDIVQNGEDEDIDRILEEIKNPEIRVIDREPNSITVLVNKELSLPTDYEPSDLVIPNVSFSKTVNHENSHLRLVAARALERLFEEAKKEDIYLNAVSGYRSYKRQYDIFTNNIKRKGLEHTMKFSAKPGYSEHQTGLTMDVSSDSANNRLELSFAKTKEAIWIAENSHRFGFIIRYPEDKTEITGYAYEPWHIRYVGISLATYLYENNLTLEEYYNFKPSIDFKNEISYDNLSDFGIDIEDVLTPTPRPTRVPTPSPTPTEEPEEDPEEPEDPENPEGDDDLVTPTITPSIKPTKIPTPTPSPEVTPTVTPTPEVTLPPEVTPTGTPTLSPTPTIEATPTPGFEDGSDIG
jgi:D-alanyl-D-alanine carboxypeptidase